jgi:hypothetical protein
MIEPTKKLFGEFVWENVYLEKTSRTYKIPNLEAAIAFGVKNNALYFTTYEAVSAADKPKVRSGRHYTATMEAKIHTAPEIIKYLEENRSVRPLWGSQDEILHRMFGRVSRNESLQEKFNRATAMPSRQERHDAIISLLRQESPEQLFLTPGHGGFIRLEDGDKSYGKDFQQIVPKIP